MYVADSVGPGPAAYYPKSGTMKGTKGYSMTRRPKSRKSK